ncbi:MAG: hypothetical protein EXR69_06925 [Myxococcales bacterium]|nr:hypothetical protein [Myxococcales bacterium]
MSPRLVSNSCLRAWASILLVGLTAPVVASAAAGPTLEKVPTFTWKKGEITKWHIESDLYTPRGKQLASMSAKGVKIAARTKKTHLVLDASCVATPEGKNAVVDCTFAYVSFTGEPWSSPADDRLTEVMAQWSADLLPARVQFVQTPEGRMKAFDLQGVKRVNASQAEIIEFERIFLQRAFCLFELPLAATPDDFKRGWKQTSDSALMMLPTTTGTGGAYDMRYTAGPVSDNLLPIDTVARGTLSQGNAMDAESGVSMDTVTLTSQAAFDLSLGLLVWRGMVLDARLTVASGDAGSDVDFYQVNALQKVDEFLPNGAAPLSLMASRAAKRNIPAPEVTAGLALTPYADLGMQPLFVPDMPLSGQQLGLPTNTIKARVEVGEEGRVTAAIAYQGYEVLAGACELALRGATFTKTGKAYAVDVDVEFRARPAAAPAAP